jgi:hypothetical protein
MHILIKTIRVFLAEIHPPIIMQLTPRAGVLALQEF